MKLYTLDNKFIKETNNYPENFTGIIDFQSGYKEYKLNGKLHRLDGPARIWDVTHKTCPGRKQWYIEGKSHRLDGPAYEWCDGTKDWYVEDKQVTKEQCKLLHSIMKLKGLI